MYPASTVRYKLVDGLIVLLDLRAGEYIVHNKVATAMWEHLLSPSHDGVQKLARQFGVSEGQVEADLTVFVRGCVESGFLRHDPSPAVERPLSSRARRSALAQRAWWALFVTTLLLARRGFAYTYQSYFRLPKAVGGDETQEALCARAERAFLQAENFFPLPKAPKDCLPRSLALYRFTQALGIAADHCIGVRRFPFEAHAWVECRGRVLLNAPGETAVYSELARM